MRATVKSHALPVYKKNRIVSLLCIFESTIILTYVLGAQKNRLIETVLLSTRNICFGLESNLPVELVKEQGTPAWFK